VGFVNHHLTLWQGLTSTQRRSLELILSFNRKQSRVIGFLTGHNTMENICTYWVWWSVLGVGAAGHRRRPQLMFYGSVKLWQHSSLTYLDCSLMDPEDVLNLSLGANGTLLKGQDSHDLDFSLQEHKRPIKGPHASGPNRLESIVFSVLFYSITFAHWIRKARNHNY